MRRKEHKNTNVHQYTPAKKHPSAQVVPGGAGGDSSGEEGEKVVDGVRGERKRDRWHQTALTVVPEINLVETRKRM